MAGAARGLRSSTVGVAGAACFNYNRNPVPLSVVLRSSSTSQSIQLMSTCSGRFGYSLRTFPRSPAFSAGLVKISSVRAGLEAMADPIQLSDVDTKLLQQQVQEFIIPRFIVPFCHKHSPLEEEAIRASRRWYDHHFGTALIPEILHKVRKINSHIIPSSVHETAELSRLAWAMEYHLFLFVLDDVVVHKTCANSSLEELLELYMQLNVVILSSFPHDPILRENLSRYFSDDLESELTKDFGEKVLAKSTRYSRTSDFDDDILTSDPICTAFSSLWSRAISEMPEEWSLRFGRIAQQAMLSQFREALNAIIDYVDDVFLPDTLYYSSPYAAAARNCG